MVFPQDAENSRWLLESLFRHTEKIIDQTRDADSDVDADVHSRKAVRLGGTNKLR